MIRDTRFVLCAFSLCTVLWSLDVFAVIRFNTSASHPAMVFVRVPLAHGDAQRHQVVQFCPTHQETLQDPATGTCPSGTRPVLKPVVAVAGDVVMLLDSGMTVNGTVIPQSARVPVTGIYTLPPGRYPVTPGQVWLLSTHHPHSLDSRYYGPVATDRLLGAYQPLF